MKTNPKINYGTNNSQAYIDDCPSMENPGGKHEWRLTENLGRCFNRYECEYCLAIHNIDSSD